MRNPILLFLLGVSTLAGCSDETRAKAREVRADSAVTWESLKDLAGASRTELEARVRAGLERLDHEIDELAVGADERTARALEDLRRKRDDLRRELTALEAAGDEAWDDLKQGVIGAYQDLTRSVETAEEDV